MYLRMLKPDKTEFQGENCCSIVDNEIVIDTSVGNGEQILSCAGKNICELHLTDMDKKTLTTWDFVVDVCKRVHNGDAITSTDEWDELDRMKQELDDLLSSNILASTVSYDNTIVGKLDVNNVQGAIDETVTKLFDHISADNPHGINISDLNMTKDDITTALGYTPYTQTEVDNKFATLESNIDWKETVVTYDDLLATYSSPEKGWTVNVGDESRMTTYRYNGTEWVDIGITAIPKATETNDGLMSKEDKAKLEELSSGGGSGEVTGVKGDAETTYRKGNVNITAENVGAATLQNIQDNFNNAAPQWGNEIFGNDVNTWVKAGLYSSISGSSTNLPNGSDGWATVLVIAPNVATDYVIQICRCWNYNATTLFKRTTNNKGVNWSNWVAIVDEGNIKNMQAGSAINDSEGRNIAEFINKYTGITGNQTVKLSSLSHGVYQYWGTYPEDSPYSEPFIIIVFIAYNFKLQIASAYSGSSIKYRTRGATDSEWCNWKNFAVGTAATEDFVLNNFDRLGLNSTDIDTKRGNWSVGLSNGTTPDGGWANIVQFDCDHFITQLGIGCDGGGGITNIYYRNRYTSGNWSNWDYICRQGKTPKGGGIEFQISNGKLQYRYDTSVWG